jgi:hypothetical protein
MGDYDTIIDKGNISPQVDKTAGHFVYEIFHFIPLYSFIIDVFFSLRFT